MWRTCDEGLASPPNTQNSFFHMKNWWYLVPIINWEYGCVCVRNVPVFDSAQTHFTTSPKLNWNETENHKNRLQWKRMEQTKNLFSLVYFIWFCFVGQQTNDRKRWTHENTIISHDARHAWCAYADVCSWWRRNCEFHLILNIILRTASHSLHWLLLLLLSYFHFSFCSWPAFFSVCHWMNLWMQKLYMRTHNTTIKAIIGPTNCVHIHFVMYWGWLERVGENKSREKHVKLFFEFQENWQECRRMFCFVLFVVRYTLTYTHTRPTKQLFWKFGRSVVGAPKRLSVVVHSKSIECCCCCCSLRPKPKMKIKKNSIENEHDDIVVVCIHWCGTVPVSFLSLVLT